MVYEIRKAFAFSASHQLEGLPADHPCSRLHGHNYLVEVVLAARELSPPGFVVDYRELDALKAMIDADLDHRHLNDVPGLGSTTAETIAAWLLAWCLERWPETVEVRVAETPKTWASARAG